MPYKTLYEELWETKGVKGNIRVQKIFDSDVHRNGDIAIRLTLTPDNIKYGAAKFFPSYQIIKALIFSLISQNGKQEVERELNIKIGGGSKNGI